MSINKLANKTNDYQFFSDLAVMGCKVYMFVCI